MECSRLCLEEFICVQDLGGFLTSGRGCLGNARAMISIRTIEAAATLVHPSWIQLGVMCLLHHSTSSSSILQLLFPPQPILAPLFPFLHPQALFYEDCAS